MSVIKFELKKGHIALIRGLKWDENINRMFNIVENESPFGGDSLTEDIGLILFGKPEGAFNPEGEEGPVFTVDQISEMFETYEELPMALEVVTNACSFEVGHYKRRYNDVMWKKYEPKEKNNH